MCTNTGSFGCVYVAVVLSPLASFVKSTCGILDVTSSSVPFAVSFTAVINLRNDKS